MASSSTNRNPAKEIPPRWLHCPRRGDAVGKFIPFKTPLDSRYDNQIPEECRFPPMLFFSTLKTYRIKVGLLVDLTNTSRFYKKEEIEGFDCRYVKLQCKGRSETPNEEQIQTFVDVCARFINQKPLEYIGVHCTHGYNRTGFLICSYLVMRESWSIEAAVQAFATARPPGIYKQQYLDELFRLYGEPEDTIKAPFLPDWCREGNDLVDDDGNPTENENGESFDNAPTNRRRKEGIKKDAKFMEGVTGVELVTHVETVHQVRSKCQNMCEFSGSGFPGSQPVSMDIQNMLFLTKKPYQVSWKADGVRYMMLINGKKQIFMIDRDNNIFHVSRLEFPRRKEPSAHISETLLDGEMILDKVNGVDIPRYLVYDIIKFENQPVGKCAFDIRRTCIDKEIVGPRHQKMQSGQLDKIQEAFSVRAKPFWDVTLSQKLLDKDGKFSREVSHEVDGLIFQPVPDPYESGRCQDVLKWKPPELNSVDFKLRIVREEKMGCLPETKGLLFVGGLDQAFDSMKVTKDLRQYDGKIIECNYDKGWKFMRERTDKSFPNGYNTAIGVCGSIKHPVTKEKLFNLINHERYQLQAQRKRASEDSSLMPPPAKRLPAH